MREAPRPDREIGVLVFATEGGPLQGKAKSFEDDFVVEELFDTQGIEEREKEGEKLYPLYRVEKKGVDTFHMERDLSSALKSRVAVGGLKDKRSLSVQFATPTSSRSLRPERVDGEKFTALRVGFLPSPLNRARVIGNRFEVTLRGCSPEVVERSLGVYSAARDRRVPNFYGHQRFGSGGGNHRVGKAIVQKKFDKAVGEILRAPRPGDDEETLEAREALVEGRFADGVRGLQPGMDVEAAVARRLSQRPGDWVGALRAVPVRLRRLYVHAYQSYLFNMTLSRALVSGEDISEYHQGDNWGTVSEGGLAVSRPHGVRDPSAAGAVPLVQIMGYAFRDYGSRFDAVLSQLAEEEEVSAKDFYVEELQEVSSEGGFRRPHIAIGGGEVELKADVARLGFSLGKGMYATALLREVLKPEDPAGSGLG